MYWWVVEFTLMMRPWPLKGQAWAHRPQPLQRAAFITRAPVFGSM